ncbi:unnamed protein product [Rotaria sp. Silwood2]|nr:unnamed protein product [Rotaria sp. Silwood2]CAF4047915.1 unnamed protein product [Rotaria sp. Silwood2]
MSEILSGPNETEVKRVSIHTDHNVEKIENQFIRSKFNRINSMQSTVTPDILDTPKSTVDKTLIRESSENRNCTIFIAIGVLLALTICLTAIALAIKFRM